MIYAHVLLSLFMLLYGRKYPCSIFSSSFLYVDIVHWLQMSKVNRAYPSEVRKGYRNL